MRGANAPSVNALTLGLMFPASAPRLFRGPASRGHWKPRTRQGSRRWTGSLDQGSGISALRTAAKAVVARHATAREESAQSLKRVAALIDPGQPGW